MTLSVKAILGIVTVCALIMAGILATLQLPLYQSSVPVGVLFGAFFILVAYGAARSVNTQGSDRFWLGFLVVSTLCFGLCCCSSISDYHSLTRHLARILFLSLPTTPESIVDQNDRYEVLRRFLDLVLAFILAFGGGLVASRSRKQRDSE
jgi:hypothetical protein